MVKGKFDFTWKEQFWRMHSRSKYGIKWDDYFAVLDDKLEESDFDFEYDELDYEPDNKSENSDFEAKVDI